MPKIYRVIFVVLCLLSCEILLKCQSLSYKYTKQQDLKKKKCQKLFKKKVTHSGCNKKKEYSRTHPNLANTAVTKHVLHRKNIWSQK